MVSPEAMTYNHPIDNSMEEESQECFKCFININLLNPILYTS